MNKQHFRRSRFQRAFLDWFRKNRKHFKVPIAIAKISTNGIELQFQKIYSDYFFISLSQDREIEIYIKWQKKLWDRLMFHTAPSQRWNRSMMSCNGAWHLPKKYHEGYVCMYCLHEIGNVKIFPSQEALWQDHLFDSLLEWVNEKLAPALWLRISCVGSTDNCEETWAQLIRDNDGLLEDDQKLLELQKPDRRDGKPPYVGGTEGVTNWLIPLKPETLMKINKFKELPERW
jgi:hypothetical protein